MVFYSNSSTSRSTTASSGYNTSDSESEADSREFRMQPIAAPSFASSTFRPVSLIFTRLSKIENQHRDELVCNKHTNCSVYMFSLIWLSYSVSVLGNSKSDAINFITPY